jgi:hypothetical protein
MRNALMIHQRPAHSISFVPWHYVPHSSRGFRKEINRIFPEHHLLPPTLPPTPSRLYMMVWCHDTTSCHQ